MMLKNHSLYSNKGESCLHQQQQQQNTLQKATHNKLNFLENKELC